MKQFVAGACLAIGGLACCGCSGSPSTATNTPPAAPPPPVGHIVSGNVRGLDASSRRLLSGAVVEFADSATGVWGQHGPFQTNTVGRYSSRPLPSGHYLARASMPGYETSTIVTVGFLDAAKTVDFELTVPGAAPLSVTSVTTTSGSTSGGTPLRVLGAGFRANATVAFGGAPGTALYVASSTTIYVTTPAQVTGAVDVVVTNPDGDAASLRGAFTYALPGTFDFNGTWAGYALAHPPTLAAGAVARHDDMQLYFTIENNALTSFTCLAFDELAPSPPVVVSDGEFAFTATGVTVSGRIVAGSISAGVINTRLCPATQWTAEKQ